MNTNKELVKVLNEFYTNVKNSKMYKDKKTNITYTKDPYVAKKCEEIALEFISEKEIKKTFKLPKNYKYFDGLSYSPDSDDPYKYIQVKSSDFSVASINRNEENKERIGIYGPSTYVIFADKPARFNNSRIHNNSEVIYFEDFYNKVKSNKHRYQNTIKLINEFNSALS